MVGATLVAVVVVRSGGVGELPRKTSNDDAAEEALQCRVDVMETSVAPFAGDKRTGATGAMTIVGSLALAMVTPPTATLTWLLSCDGALLDLSLIHI